MRCVAGAADEVVTGGDVAVVQSVEDAYVGVTTTTCVVQAAADHAFDTGAADAMKQMTALYDQTALAA